MGVTPEKNRFDYHNFNKLFILVNSISRLPYFTFTSKMVGQTSENVNIRSLFIFEQNFDLPQRPFYIEAKEIIDYMFKN